MADDPQQPLLGPVLGVLAPRDVREMARRPRKPPPPLLVRKGASQSNRTSANSGKRASRRPSASAAESSTSRACTSSGSREWTTPSRIPVEQNRTVRGPVASTSSASSIAA